jgi:hypothetical protein
VEEISKINRRLNGEEQAESSTADYWSILQARFGITE